MKQVWRLQLIKFIVSNSDSLHVLLSAVQMATRSISWRSASKPACPSNKSQQPRSNIPDTFLTTPHRSQGDSEPERLEKPDTAANLQVIITAIVERREALSRPTKWPWLHYTVFSPNSRVPKHCGITVSHSWSTVFASRRQNLSWTIRCVNKTTRRHVYLIPTNFP